VSTINAGISRPTELPAVGRVWVAKRWAYRLLPETCVLVIAVFFRFWQLAMIGFNSDEAVYAGTAAAISGDENARTIFPVFRAHPLLLQMLVSVAYRVDEHSDWAARSVPALIGVLAVAMTYLLGRRLYGRQAGLFAGALLAVMPYHVVVSRQVLLDGLMTLAATAALYCVARYTREPSARWMIATGAMLGVTLITKETGLVLVGGLYVFFALTPAIRLNWRHLLAGAATTGLIAIQAQIVLVMAGRTSSGQHYFLWQMFRRPNHSAQFYFTTLPQVIGPALLVAILAGLIWLRRENDWRERLLLCWMAVPVVFFTLWPVKGYQYLLPAAPALAVLGGRVLFRACELRLPWLPRFLMPAVAAGVVVSLAVPAYGRVDPAPTRTFLAGTGGLAGGREAGVWIRDHVPVDSKLLSIGPSMANVLQFYSRRRLSALSVSTNPSSRNPSYLPVPNPDQAVRSGQYQYVVWDSYTANRTPFFTAKAQALIDKFHGVAVFTATVPVKAESGALVEQPVVIIYEVRP
jgi:4-amino-4-deoxy-L-arabinose transferase-like glycosyltransferase